MQSRLAAKLSGAPEVLAFRVLQRPLRHRGCKERPIFQQDRMSLHGSCSPNAAAPASSSIEACFWRTPRKIFQLERLCSIVFHASGPNRDRGQLFVSHEPLRLPHMVILDKAVHLWQGQLLTRASKQARTCTQEVCSSTIWAATRSVNICIKFDLCSQSGYPFGLSNAMGPIYLEGMYSNAW